MTTRSLGLGSLVRRPASPCAAARKHTQGSQSSAGPSQRGFWPRVKLGVLGSKVLKRPDMAKLEYSGSRTSTINMFGNETKIPTGVSRVPSRQLTCSLSRRSWPSKEASRMQKGPHQEFGRRYLVNLFTYQNLNWFWHFFCFPFIGKSHLPVTGCQLSPVLFLVPTAQRFTSPCTPHKHWFRRVKHSLVFSANCSHSD